MLGFSWGTSSFSIAPPLAPETPRGLTREGFGGEVALHAPPAASHACSKSCVGVGSALADVDGLRYGSPCEGFEDQRGDGVRAHGPASPDRGNAMFERLARPAGEKLIRSTPRLACGYGSVLLARLLATPASIRHWCTTVGPLDGPRVQSAVTQKCTKLGWPEVLPHEAGATAFLGQACAPI